MKHSYLLGALVLIFGLNTSVEAQQIVSPGTTGYLNAFPFEAPMRLQQVYGASDFSSLTGPAYLTQIAFRPLNPQTSFIGQIEIRLSTTSNSPDGLSSAFSSNVGGNEILGYSGPLPISIDSSEVNNFSFVINLQIPFLYNPAAGNLLIDYKNFTGHGSASPIYFGAANVIDSVSRIWTFGNANALVASTTDTIGLITEFTFVPVPEPSSLALVAAGIFGALCYRRKGK
jgi:hypothetical protein